MKTINSGFTPLEIGRQRRPLLCISDTNEANSITSTKPIIPLVQTSLTGFTLLEVIIVMSIMVMMIGGATYVIFNAQETFDEGSMTSFLESQATRLIDVMKDDISECLVMTPTPTVTCTSLSIKVPVLVSGNYWNPATGAVYWGANDTLGWHIKYDFSVVRTISEATDSKDYNRDNDISDSFNIGEIVKYVYSADSEIAANLQETVKLCNDIMYGDINNDGANDPIFTLRDKDGNIVTSGGNRVRINIWLGGKLGAKQNPIIINTTTTILLMNPQ